ncbi:MAG: lycopene cyclase domain-containing protein [Actinomycetes bacterium]
MQFLYLAGLIFSIIGLGLFDWKFKLGFSTNKKAALLATLLPLIFFLLWDGAGIALGIFFRGETSHLTGLDIAPELPLEELFFLFLLNYTTLTIFITVKRIMAKR